MRSCLGRSTRHRRSAPRHHGRLSDAGGGLTKKALHEGPHNTLTEQLALELDLQFEAAETEDYAEGVTAFLEKRTAKFQGK